MLNRTTMNEKIQEEQKMTEQTLVQKYDLEEYRKQTEPFDEVLSRRFHELTRELVEYLERTEELKRAEHKLKYERSNLEDNDLHSEQGRVSIELETFKLERGYADEYFGRRSRCPSGPDLGPGIINKYKSNIFASKFPRIDVSFLDKFKRKLYLKLEQGYEVSNGTLNPCLKSVLLKEDYLGDMKDVLVVNVPLFAS